MKTTFKHSFKDFDLEIRLSGNTYKVYLIEKDKETLLLRSDKQLICKAYIDGYIDGQEGKGLSEHAYITG